MRYASASRYHIQPRLIVVLLLAVAALTDVGCCMEYRTLRIGTKDSEPLSYKSNGKWIGFDWQMMDWMLNKGLLKYGNITFNNYTIVEGYTDNSMGFQGLNEDAFDIWLASPTKTASREGIVDFSHTFFKTGLRIIAHSSGAGASFIGEWLKAVFTSETTFVFVLVAVGVISIASLVWMLEMLDSKQEMKYFSVGPLGILQAIGWALNTMLSPAYNKKPRHPASRVLSTVLARSNIFLTALITAVFTAATITAPATGITGADALGGHLVAVIPGSTAATWVMNQGDIPSLPYADVGAAFDGFANQEVEAFVYDAPRILWWNKQQAKGGNNSYIVLPDLFAPQDYGIVTREGRHDILEMIDIAVLTFMNDAIYQTYYHQWFSVNTTAVSNDFKWTPSHYVGVIVGPIMAFILAIVVRAKFMKKEGEQEALRNIDEDLRHQKIHDVKPEDLGFVMAKMISNQANLLRYSYLLTHRDRFYADQPISRQDIDDAVGKMRKAAEEFLDRVTSYEAPEASAAVAPRMMTAAQRLKQKLTGKGKDGDRDKSLSADDEEGNSGSRLRSTTVDESSVLYRGLSLAAQSAAGFAGERVNMSAQRERPSPEEGVNLSQSVRAEAGLDGTGRSETPTDRRLRAQHARESEIRLREMATEITEEMRDDTTRREFLARVNPWQRSKAEGRGEDGDSAVESKEEYPEWGAF